MQLRVVLIARKRFKKLSWVEGANANSQALHHPQAPESRGALLLLRLARATPYCLVCGDPTAPSFITASENANVPPSSQAGSVPWKLSLKGHAQSLIFQAAKGAADHRRATNGSGRQMERSSVGKMAPLYFAQNPELDSSVSGSRALLGWRFGAAAMVVINAGPATAILGAPICAPVCS